MILPSRISTSPDDFVELFLSTLTPGLLQRMDFIQWQIIYEKLLNYQETLEFYTQIKKFQQDEPTLIQELADSYLADENPKSLLAGALNLLGHTDYEFVTQQDDINIYTISQDITNGNEAQAKLFVEVLLDLGFTNVLKRNELSDVLFGVCIGLETHRRKNLGGNAFIAAVRPVLRNTINQLIEQGYEVEFSEEKTIRYGDLSKKVDFIINYNKHPRFAIEANFYTTTGSKPTEIKRSYGNIRRQLDEVGIHLIWVTDGKGYRRMGRSLRDAYTIHPNTYNLLQFEQYFASDLQSVLDQYEQ